MATTNLGITELLEAQSNKVVTVNEALEALDAAVTAVIIIDVDATADSAGITITQAVLASGIAFYLNDDGADGAFDVRLPAVSRLFVVENQTGFDATIYVDPAADGADGTTVVVADTEVKILLSDGTNVVEVSASAGGGGGDVEVQDEGVTETAAASVLNFTGAGVTATDAGGGVVDIDIPGGGGGGGGGFEVISNYTVTGTPTEIDFDVSGYTDILILCRDITKGASQSMNMRVSTDGGSSFFATTADYQSIASAGTTSGINGIPVSGTSSAALCGYIEMFDIDDATTPVKFIKRTETATSWFRANSDPITDVRFYNSGGTTFTGGTIIVLGRPS